jgi:four helix bundle protein
MKTLKTHHDLDVWTMSIDLVVKLYKITGDFPSEERYGLVSQIRRAGVSIPSNIAEGFSRTSSRELLYFINVALGSASEIETQLEVSARLGFLKNAEHEKELLIKIRKMLIMLRKSISKRIRNTPLPSN